MRLAIIPARGGSKRIPRKNIKDFCDKPIIGWSIEAAIKSRCFDAVIVSTDDEEIAEIARDFGAETPFNRPAELSNDHAGTVEVIAHGIEWYIQHGHTPEEVCCIYATAPFITDEKLKQGLELLLTTQSEFVIPVTSYAFPIQRAVKISAEYHIEMFKPEEFKTRSQDLEEAYHDAGQFYWGKASSWLKKGSIFSGLATPFILPRYEVQDIDTVEDWIYAERMFKSRSFNH